MWWLVVSRTGAVQLGCGHYQQQSLGGRGRLGATGQAGFKAWGVGPVPSAKYVGACLLRSKCVGSVAPWVSGRLAGRLADWLVVCLTGY